MEVADWEHGSKERQRGGQLGAEGTASTHRDFHVVGALVVLLVQHLEVVAAGGCQAGGRDGAGLLPAPHSPGPSLLAPGPSDLPLSVWVRIPITTC